MIQIPIDRPQMVKSMSALESFRALPRETQETLRLTLARLERRRTRRGRRRRLFRICVALQLWTAEHVFEFLHQQIPEFFWQGHDGWDIYVAWLDQFSDQVSPHKWARIRYASRIHVSWFHIPHYDSVIVYETEDQVGDWPPERRLVSYIPGSEARHFDFDIYLAGYDVPSRFQSRELKRLHMVYTLEDFEDMILDQDRDLFRATSQQVREMIYECSPSFHADLFSIVFDYVRPPQLVAD